MRDIRRLDSSEPLVERLTSPKLPETGIAVFGTIMDLLIFSAGVGFANKRMTPVPSTGKAVPFRIFENNQKDGYIFLIALAHTQDSDAIASQNDDEAARIFEEYAAGGVEEIASWLNETPDDISGVQPLLTKIQDLIKTNVTKLPSPSPL
jgi:dnd system-associated protein 4